MTGYRIELTAEQLERARRVARDVAAKFAGGTERTMRYAAERPIDEIQDDAFPAELAVSIATGQIWNWRDPKLPDVGKRTEVRQTRAGRHLILYRKTDRKPDYPSRLYVLVVGVPPAFEILGWLRGSDGMRAIYWRERGASVRAPSFWIPASDLRPVASFPDLGSGATIERRVLAPRICPSCSSWHAPLTLCSR